MENNQDDVRLLYGIDPASVLITSDPARPEINSIVFNIANPKQAQQRRFLNEDKLTPVDVDQLPFYDSFVENTNESNNLSWFWIWFPWGAKKGDLATSNASQNITVSPFADNDKWYCRLYSSSAIGVYWILFPKENIVLAPEESVAFEITNIISNELAGMSYMYVKNKNILDYDDELVSIHLMKYSRVAIQSVQVRPNPAVLKKGVADVDIFWEVKDFTTLVLTPFNQDVTKRNSYTAQVDKNTDITLFANGSGPGNIAIKSVSVTTLPSVNSFQCEPRAVYYKDFPHDVQLCWDIDTRDNVYLKNSIDENTESVSSSGVLQKRISKPQMWTIFLKNPADYSSLKRDAQINAFKISSNQVDLNISSSGIAASPDSQLIAVCDSENNHVLLLNTLTYDTSTKPVSVGECPVAVRFSNGGDFLFTINKTGKSVTVVSYHYNTIPPIDILLDGEPKGLALSPDDEYLFVSVDKGADQAGELVILKKSMTGYKLNQTIPVGKNPAGLDVAPSGAQVYVTSPKDNSLAVVGYSPFNGEFSFVRNIEGLQSNPVDVAVGGVNGDTLLIVCKGTNKVIIVDHDDRGGSPRQEVQTGVSPGAITITPDKSIAFVANMGDSSLTMIGCDQGVGKCKILEPSLKVGDHPAYIALSGDGAIVFINGSGREQLDVLNLIQYERSDKTVAVGNLPTDVAITSDEKNVVVWHNALGMQQSPQKPSPGLCIYNILSETVTSKLTDHEIIKYINHPDAALSKGFAIAKDKKFILVINTSTFKVQIEIPVPDNDNLNTVPIDITLSADGTSLYLLTIDENGSYALLIFECDACKNIYNPQGSSLKLFTSTESSNIVLLANTPDGSIVFVSNAIQKKIYVIIRDPQEGYKLHPDAINLDAFVISLIASQDNQCLYVMTKLGMHCGFSLLDTDTLNIKNISLPASWDLISNLQAMVLSPDGQKLFVTDADVAGVRVIDTSSFRIEQSIFMNQDFSYPMGIAMLRDASRFFIAGQNSNNLAQINQISEQL